MKLIILFFILFSSDSYSDKFWLNSGAHVFGETQLRYDSRYKEYNQNSSDNFKTYPHIYNNANQACQAFVDSIMDSNSWYSNVFYDGKKFNDGLKEIDVQNVGGDLFNCAIIFTETASNICYPDEQYSPFQDGNLPYKPFGNVFHYTGSSNSDHGSNIYNNRLRTTVFSSSLPLKHSISSSDPNAKLWQYSDSIHFQTINNRSDLGKCISYGQQNTRIHLRPVQTSHYHVPYVPNQISTYASAFIIRVPDTCGLDQVFNENLQKCTCDDGNGIDPILGCDYSVNCPINHMFQPAVGLCIKNDYFCSQEENKLNPVCVDTGDKIADPNLDKDDDGIVDSVTPEISPNISKPNNSICSTSLSCYESCFSDSSFCDVSQHGLLNDGLYFRWFNFVTGEWDSSRSLSQICREFQTTTYDIDYKSIDINQNFGTALLSDVNKIWCYPAPDMDSSSAVYYTENSRFSETPYIIDFVFDIDDKLKNREQSNEELIIGGGDSKTYEGGECDSKTTDCSNGTDSQCDASFYDCINKDDGSCTGDDCVRTFDGVISSFQERISKSDILSSMDKLVWPSSDTCVDFVFSFNSELFGKSFSINEPIPMCENFDLIQLVMSSLLFIFTGFSCFRIIMGA
jgi:hypothetical protein